MSCGTGECSCGCGEILHIHVKSEATREIDSKRSLSPAGGTGSEGSDPLR
jgi:hypothetical protein